MWATCAGLNKENNSVSICVTTWKSVHHMDVHFLGRSEEGANSPDTGDKVIVSHSVGGRKRFSVRPVIALDF